MKKFLRIVSIILGSILLLLILIPVLFKSKIETVVKEKINESVYATVDWSRFSLSLLRGFPDLSINLHQLSVVGVDAFEGDSLLVLKRFELRVNPFSAIRKDIQVSSILLDQPMVNAIVLDDGSENWDIALEAPEEVSVEEGTESESSMKVSLEKFSIKKGQVFYKDALMIAEASMDDFNLVLSGEFSEKETELDLNVDVSGIDAIIEGVPYMKRGEFGLDLIAAANMVDNHYTILENEIRINDLVLGSEGQVYLLEDDAMDLDIRFFSKLTSFQSLLSLVPAVYLHDFEALETSGSLALEGELKGVMRDSIMPDALIKLQVSDGYFSYPDLPKDVSDVQIGLTVDYNGKDVDLSTIDLNEFHLLLGGNPFDASLFVDHPISDMHVAGAIKGLIDFGSLKDVLPLEDINLNGRMTTDLTVDTRMSFIEKEDYENVNLDGLILLEEVEVVSPDILVPVQVKRFEMNFNPRYVGLSGADLKLGQSDLKLEGALTNFIPYVFKGETVSGALKVSSTLFDANEILPETPDEMSDSLIPTPGSPADSLTEIAQTKIPENIDFLMELDMKKLIYEEIIMENVVGELKVSEGVAQLEALEMDVIDGHVKVTGRVDTRKENTLANLSMDLQEVDIPSAYANFVTVERLAPMAKYCKGDANVQLDFSSLLDASFSPIYETVSAKGRIFTRGVQIYNMSSFVRLSELLKNEKFKEMTPDNMDIKFRIEEGKVIVDPFDVAFENSKMRVSGLHGIDMSLDYLLDMTIAKSDLGRGATEVMDGVSSLAASAGFKIPESDYVKIKAKIVGTFQDPKITTDLSGNLASGTEVVKAMVEERVAEEVQKVEEEVREEASEKADEIIKEAEEEVAKILEQADNAGKQLVLEAEKQGENLVKEAGSNPLKKMAANRAAEELVKQANKQSENMLNEARVKADEILAAAKAEASKL